MRKPIVKNKYNLTMKDCRHLTVKDRSKICEPLFWRNNVVNAWCISGSTVKSAKEDEYCCYDEFWLGVYDEDAKAYAGKVKVNFSAYGGMCNYNFNKFYDYRKIENEADLEVQEMFLEKINVLLDEGILEVQK